MLKDTLLALTEDEYIDYFGILLDDVLISRDKAIKRNQVRISDEVCPLCEVKGLELFTASNDDEMWNLLCGVKGEALFCGKCMRLVGFEVRMVS